MWEPPRGTSASLTPCVSTVRNVPTRAIYLMILLFKTRRRSLERVFVMQPFFEGLLHRCIPPEEENDAKETLDCAQLAAFALARPCVGSRIRLDASAASVGIRGGHQCRHRAGGSVSAAQPTQLRPERLHLQSRHAAERDPGDGRRGGKTTGLQPVRKSALCAAVRARHIWIQ